MFLDKWRHAFRATWLPVFVCLMLLSGTRSLYAQAAKGGTEDLTQADLDALDLAIKILQDKAAFDQRSADARTARLGRVLAQAVAGFKKVRDAGHVRKAAEVQGEDAKTNGKGDVLNTGVGDTSVTIDKEIMEGAAGSPCTFTFIELLWLIAHEGVHTTQPDFNPISPSQIEAMLRTHHNSEDLVRYKQDLLNSELPAYELDSFVMEEIRDEFRQMLGNVKARRKTLKNARSGDMGSVPGGHTVPAWAQEFINHSCSPEGIDTFVNNLGKAFERDHGIFSDLDILKTNVTAWLQGQPPPPMSPERIAEVMDDDSGYKDILPRAASHGISMVIDSYKGVIRGSNPDGCDWELDTGMGGVQDAEIIHNSSGSLFIVASGTEDFPPSTGIVRVFPVPDGSPITVPVPPAINIVSVSFADSHCTTLSCDNQSLENPSSILVAPDGRMWIWDVAQAALFALRDDNTDGIPDRIDFHNDVQIPRNLQLAATEYSYLKWYGPQPILQMRVENVLDHGRQAVIAFLDQDANGTFHSVDVTTWSRLIQADRAHH